MLVLTDAATIYFYTLKHVTSIMTNEMNMRQFRDADKQLLDQRLSTFELGQVRPPQYDCQRQYAQPTVMVERQDTWYEKTFARGGKKSTKRKKMLSRENSGEVDLEGEREEEDDE